MLKTTLAGLRAHLLRLVLTALATVAVGIVPSVVLDLADKASFLPVAAP